ncbi:MAG TPA: spermidine synthase, partial [Roseiflexaceae bacterium]|nr:spermidine synthase [Roseiflexaceae bacterium]
METAWQRHNRAAVTERMRQVCAAPDGVLETARAGRLLLEIHKQARQVSLFFRDPDTGELDGPMSRIECERPFALPGEYTQAVLLALLWQAKPQRACMLGFGGGRL